MNPPILASILSADPLRLGEEIASVWEAGIRSLHIDLLDGQFAPNLSCCNQKGVQQIRKLYPQAYLDLHLMCNHPLGHIDALRKWVDAITVHVELGERVVREALSRMEGIKKGVAINPGTEIEKLWPFLEEVDLICIMGVEPGFGGQKFLSQTLERILEVRERLGEGTRVKIEVDGGMDPGTLLRARLAGANLFVCGSALFACEDRKKAALGLSSILCEIDAPTG